MMEDEPQLVPPENFAMVSPGIYRGAMPKKKTYPFLLKLKIRGVLTLILEDYPAQNLKFLQANDIALHQFGVSGNKEPFVDIDEKVIADALKVLLDPRNHPVLIHCNKGKHRTGCLVGCLRRMQGWALTPIFTEYRHFAGTKARSLDMQFIELFDSSSVGLQEQSTSSSSSSMPALTVEALGISQNGSNEREEDSSKHKK
ncbi:protein-tyrosine phosphatase [Ramicandelaber brevisporus]|nr:protein-tyrosine phosphatase [Ramicandelaber brevisporus]